MPSPHMHSQPIRTSILSSTSVDGAWITNFGTTGPCASLGLEVTRQVSQRMYTCQNGAAAIRARYAILGVDVGSFRNLYRRYRVHGSRRRRWYARCRSHVRICWALASQQHQHKRTTFEETTY